MVGRCRERMPYIMAMVDVYKHLRLLGVQVLAGGHSMLHTFRSRSRDLYLVVPGFVGSPSVFLLSPSCMLPDVTSAEVHSEGDLRVQPLDLLPSS
jgi:hypothetical protein